MGITVKRALTLNPLKGTYILAGSGGLDREFGLVNVMEVPDIFDWVSANELIVTTGYPFKDSPEELVNLIIKLHEKNVTGLAIKPNRFINELPAEVIKMANSLNFPLLSLPPDAHFDKIILELLTEIINQDYKVIKKADEIHKTLTRLVLDGGKFKEIAESLAFLCFGEVVIKESSGYILSRAYPAEGNGLTCGPAKKTGQDHIYEKQVQLSNEVIAVIYLISWREEIEKEDIMAIDYAANIIAMTLLKHESALEREKRFRNNFLNDLINGKIKYHNLAIERSKHLGLDLSLPYTVIIFSLDTSPMSIKEQGNLYEILEQMDKLISSAFEKTGKKCIHWNAGRHITILYSINPKSKGIMKESSVCAAEIKEFISQHFTQAITAGIGTYHPDVMGLQHSYQEAYQAIVIGRKIWGSDGIYSYDDLGIYPLLLKLSESDEYVSFVNSLLGKLLDYDKKKNTQLLLTLEYLLNKENEKKIAEELYVHAKTVSFRKKRIEEILDTSLDNPENRLALSVALKLYWLTVDSNSESKHRESRGRSS